MCCIYLFPLCLLFFGHFPDGFFQQTEVLNYTIFKVINRFFFIHSAFCVFSKKSFPIPTSWGYSPLLTFEISLILPFTLRTLIYLKLIFVWSVRIDLQFHYFSLQIPNCPISFVEKSLLSPLIHNAKSVKYQVFIYSSEYLWPLCSVPLIYLSNLVPIWHCLNYCNVVMSLAIW